MNQSELSFNIKFDSPYFTKEDGFQAFILEIWDESVEDSLTQYKWVTQEEVNDILSVNGIPFRLEKVEE